MYLLKKAFLLEKRHAQEKTVMRRGASHIRLSKKIDSSVGKNIHFLKNSVVNTFYENAWENSSNLSHKW